MARPRSDGPAVSDRALLRFLARAGGMEVEALRHMLSEALQRANAAAKDVGGGDYLVTTLGMTFVVREGDNGAVVTTVLDAQGHRHRFHALRAQGAE